MLVFGVGLIYGYLWFLAGGSFCRDVLHGDWWLLWLVLVCCWLVCCGVVWFLCVVFDLFWLVELLGLGTCVGTLVFCVAVLVGLVCVIFVCWW